MLETRNTTSRFSKSTVDSKTVEALAQDWGLKNEQVIDNFNKKRHKMNEMVKKTRRRNQLKDPTERLQQIRRKVAWLKEQSEDISLHHPHLQRNSRFFEPGTGKDGHISPSKVESLPNHQDVLQHTRQTENIRDVIYLWDNENYHPDKVYTLIAN